MFSALSQISKHSVDLAEMVVEAEIFPSVLTCLTDQDEYVKKNCATLIREIAKHTPEVRLHILALYSITVNIGQTETILFIFRLFLEMKRERVTCKKYGFLNILYCMYSLLIVMR